MRDFFDDSTATYPLADVEVATGASAAAVFFGTGVFTTGALAGAAASAAGAALAAEADLTGGGDGIALTGADCAGAGSVTRAADGGGPWGGICGIPVSSITPGTATSGGPEGRGGALAVVAGGGEPVGMGMTFTLRGPLGSSLASAAGGALVGTTMRAEG